MTSRDDLREAIKAGNLADALVMAMSNAVELNITTWVTSEEKKPKLAKEVRPGESLRSQINLVEGKINNEVGEQFVDSTTHKALKRFHLEQVLQGNKTIRDNIKSLQKLFELLQAIKKHQGDGALSQEALLDLFSSTISRQTEIAVVPPSTTTPEMESEEPEIDDDWDDSVLDIFESVPNQDISEENTPRSNSKTELLIETSEEDLLMPAPEMPVTDLEVEDWEEARVEFLPGIDSDWKNDGSEGSILSLDDLDASSEEKEEEEDWGDLLEEGEEATSAQDLVDGGGEFIVDTDKEEDWEDFDLVEEDIDAEPATVVQHQEEDWGNFEQENTLSPDSMEVEVINEEAETESMATIDQDGEDWGNLLEEEETTSPQNFIDVKSESVIEGEPVAKTLGENSFDEEDSFIPETEANIFESESLTEDSDEDWGDWLEEETNQDSEELVNTNVTEETTYQAPIIPNLDSLDLEDNDDWEEEEQAIDTFEVPYDDASVIDSEFDEDWDEFSTGELEPYSDLNLDESQQVSSEGEGKLGN